jgi:sulfur-oxidizing protein SoxX
MAAATISSGAPSAFEIAGDAIPAPLEGRKGDAARGLGVILDRRTGNCLICHALSVPDEAFQGEIGPSLDGVGSRLSPGQIRLRIVDQSRLNPDTLMPPYFRVTGLINVAPEYRGKPALDAQQIEDIVTYLSGLKE